MYVRTCLIIFKGICVCTTLSTFVSLKLTHVNNELHIDTFLLEFKGTQMCELSLETKLAITSPNMDVL